MHSALDNLCRHRLLVSYHLYRDEDIHPRAHIRDLRCFDILGLWDHVPRSLDYNPMHCDIDHVFGSELSWDPERRRMGQVLDDWTDTVRNEARLDLGRDKNATTTEVDCNRIEYRNVKSAGGNVEACSQIADVGKLGRDLILDAH